MSLKPSLSLPCVRKLQAYHVQYSFSVCAVVIINKLLELHLALCLFGHVNDIHDSVWTYKANKDTSMHYFIVSLNETGRESFLSISNLYTEKKLNCTG